MGASEASCSQSPALLTVETAIRRRGRDLEGWRPFTGKMSMKALPIIPALRQQFADMERMKKFLAWPPEFEAMAKRMTREREQLNALAAPPVSPPPAPRPELNITIDVI